MTCDGKKPGVAFWATVVVVGALVYVISWGPFVWLASRDFLPGPPGDALTLIYCPVGWMAGHGPEPFQGALTWYFGLCYGR
jgi:hypothetical protein